MDQKEEEVMKIIGLEPELRSPNQIQTLCAFVSVKKTLSVT